MDKKICVVTGANSGIGKSICIELAKHNVHIVMVCRDQQKGMEAQNAIKELTGNQSIDLVTADLASIKSIRELAAELQKRYPAINVLINNAGVTKISKELSADGIELTLATNYLAPILLTRLLLGSLKAGAPARVINVSSDAHFRGHVDLDDWQYNNRPYKFFEAYVNSKILLNSMSFAMAKELEGSGVTLNCIHPGAVRTNLGKSKTSWLQNALVNIIMLFFISPEKAAKPIVKLALDQQFNDTNGKYFSMGNLRTANAQSLDPEFAKQLKIKTDELLKTETL